MPVATGLLTEPAAPGAQSVTGVGFTPVALILFMTGNQSDGVWVDPIKWCYGFTDGTNSFSFSAAMDDNVNPTQAYTRAAPKVITIIDGVNALQGECDLTSFDADGFTLNWTTANGTQYLIGYMAIGGTGVQAYVQEWKATALGNKSLPGSGFTPQVVLFASPVTTDHAPETPTSEVYARVGIGAMDDNGNQWSHNIRSINGVGGTDNLRDASDARVLQHNDAAFTGVSFNVAFVSMDANGYTVNIATKLFDYWVNSLEIAGLDDVLVGNFNPPVVAGTQTIVTGFQPNGVFGVGSGPTLVSPRVADIFTSMGLCGVLGTDVVGTISEPDGNNPSQEKALLKSGKSFAKAENVTQTITQEADVNSYPANGFELDWTAVDGLATPVRFYIAFAAPAVPSVVTPGGVGRDSVQRPPSISGHSRSGSARPSSARSRRGRSGRGPQVAAAGGGRAGGPSAGAGPRVWVEIQSSLGANFGQPLINVLDWESTKRLDRAGTFSFTIPSGDRRRLNVTDDEKREAHAFTIVGGNPTEIGVGIIDTNEGISTPDSDDVTLRVSGDDLLRELTYRIVGDLEIESTITTAAQRVGTETNGNQGVPITTDIMGGGVDQNDRNYLYIGQKSRFDSVELDLSAFSANPAVLRGQYFSGAIGTAGTAGWNTITIVDGTAAGGVTMAQDGTISWTRPDDWDTLVHGPDTTEAFYWMRFDTTTADATQPDPTIDRASVQIDSPISVGGAVDLVMAFAPGSWSTSGSQDSSTQVYFQLHGETVLESLGRIAEASNEHFRLGTGRQVVWVTSGAASNVRLIGPQGISGTGIESNDDVAIITSLDKVSDTYDQVSRVYPQGGGFGKGQFTIFDATDTLGGNYTVNTGGSSYDYINNYVERDASVADFGRIERAHTWNHIVPEIDDEANRQSTANQLLFLARDWLDDHAAARITYNVGVNKLERTVNVGDTINVIYKHYVGTFAATTTDTYQSGANTISILEATTRIDQTGLRTSNMVLSEKRRWPLTEQEDIVFRLMGSANINKNDQVVYGNKIIAGQGAPGMVPTVAQGRLTMKMAYAGAVSVTAITEVFDQVSLSTTCGLILDINTNGLGAIEFDVDTQSANTFWLGPTGGGAKKPEFRGVIPDDITAGSGAFDVLSITAGPAFLWRTPSDDTRAGIERILKSDSSGDLKLNTLFAGADIRVGTITTSSGMLALREGTTITSGIAFGTDVTLYRSAADTLKTDDTFYTTLSIGAGIAAPLGKVHASDSGVGVITRMIVEQSDPGEESRYSFYSGAAELAYFGFDDATDDFGFFNLIGAGDLVFSMSAGSAAHRFDGSGSVGFLTTGTQGLLNFRTGTTITSGIAFGQDVTLYRSAASVLRTDDNVRVMGTLGVGTSGAARRVHILTAQFDDGMTIESTEAGNSFGPRLKLYRNSASPIANDLGGTIQYFGEDSGGNETGYAAIGVKFLSATNGSEAAELQFYTAEGGVNTQHMVLDDTGRLGVNIASPLAQCHIDQDSSSAAIPVLTLDQADTSEGTINFIASDRGAIPATVAAVSVRVELAGVVYRIPLYPDA